MSCCLGFIVRDCRGLLLSSLTQEQEIIMGQSGRVDRPQWPFYCWLAPIHTHDYDLFPSYTTVCSRLFIFTMHSHFLSSLICFFFMHQHTRKLAAFISSRALTESKQHCLHQPMCIRATGTPFIPIISDYHHWVLLLLLMFICTSRQNDLYHTLQVWIRPSFIIHSLLIHS